VAAAIALSPAAGEEARLNVYNWSDYIAPDTIAKFEAETGIKITYDVYDGNEVLEAKLLSGRSGYDIVVPSASPFMARQITAGVYQALDKDKLPNWQNLDRHILELVAVADPENVHGAPYLWSDTGIGYNETQLHAVLGNAAPVDSLALILASIRRAATSAISRRPLMPSKKSAPTSANSILRNTSTILPMAICASRSAIRAM